MAKEQQIVTISLWETIKVYFFTSIFGLLIVCKMLVKWIWDPKTFLVLEQRDTPPACLVDSTLGQHKYIKLKGVKFHYVESGSKDQPLLLLLHGFPDCWLSWRHQIPLFSPHFRVIALDLKGFGDSDKPSSRKTYRVDTIVDELKQLIVSLGVQSCTVVGHDIGALLGWYLAHQFPEVVVKLVAVSCPHPNIYRGTLSDYRWLNFAQLPYFPEVDALREDVKIVGKYHKHLVGGDVVLEAYKYTFSRKEDWTGPLNYLRNLVFVEIAENCKMVQVPVVMITGDKDKFTKLEGIVKSTDYCEKSQVKIVDGAWHFPHQEKHSQFNEILLKCLVKRSVLKEEVVDRSPSKSIVNRMFGAINTYGNSVLDSVHKKRNGVVGINLLSYANVYDRTDP